MINSTYEAYISAYIKREHSEDMTPHLVFAWTLYNDCGIVVTENEAKHLAYEIAYRGVCEVEEYL